MFFMKKIFCALLLSLCLVQPVLAKSVKPAPVPSHPAPPRITWLDISTDQRRQIVDAWLKMDDTTRPPFPVYRDSELDRISRKMRPAPQNLIKN